MSFNKRKILLESKLKKRYNKKNFEKNQLISGIVFCNKIGIYWLNANKSNNYMTKKINVISN